MTAHGRIPVKREQFFCSAALLKENFSFSVDDMKMYDRVECLAAIMEIITGSLAYNKTGFCHEREHFGGPGYFATRDEGCYFLGIYQFCHQKSIML